MKRYPIIVGPADWAFETVEQCLSTLQRLGFDTATVNAGYGIALDFVMDGVINALGAVSQRCGETREVSIGSSRAPGENRVFSFMYLVC
ncbi:hypothetical protein C1H69_10150 [Billgrantia endophytica]|uniref:Uncharacterized protein n=1 Tax=Billgrantia endophytica TaxID=2033802 RepID=A0A2N7U4C9_9GAMM|nr:hypothetical protein C1H69_10150 [Halomonas endophytica]